MASVASLFSIGVPSFKQVTRTTTKSRVSRSDYGPLLIEKKRRNEIS